MKTRLFTKDFNLVIIGQIISLFGGAILRFALPIYLLQQTQSAMLFGIVTACSYIPLILFSIVGGVIADRVNKRNVMVVLDFFTAVIMSVFFIIYKIVDIVPLVTITMLLLSGIGGVYQPSVQSSIPLIVDKNNMLKGVAVVTQVGSLDDLICPILGGILFSIFGLTPILFVSIVCFALSAIIEMFIKIPHVKIKRTENVFKVLKNDFKDSYVYLKKGTSPILKIILIVFLVNLFLTTIIIVGFPVLIVQTLKMSEEMLGVSQGIMALGGLSGGIYISICSGKIKIDRAYFYLICASLALVVISVPFIVGATAVTCYVLLCVMSFCIMFSATVFTIQMMTAIQVSTPADLVGKVISFAMVVGLTSQPLGMLLYGIALEYLVGYEGYILLFSAVISLIVSLVSIITIRNIKWQEQVIENNFIKDNISKEDYRNEEIIIEDDSSND